MSLKIALAIAALALAEPAMAKDTRFWNLTSSTVTSLELAPVATNAFGPNQCLNDPDKVVDHDERVKVADVVTGVYVARLRFADGRTCQARNVQIEVGKTFAIEDKDLTDCGK
jgi:hypothetical protein